MESKKIVILGGGIGGIVTANELQKHLPSGHKITLIEKETHHSFAPSYLWVMTGMRKPGQIVRELRNFISPGIEVIHAEVKGIDLISKGVKLDNWILGYDYLVIAMGAEISFDSIPGLDNSVLNFYTLDGAERLHKELDNIKEENIAVVICSLPYKCPAAPNEGALLINNIVRKRGLNDKVEVHLFTPEPYPMPVGGPKLGEMVRHTLESNGVNFNPLHKLTSIDQKNKQLHFEGKDSFSYDMLVVIPPHKASDIFREAELANPAGYIPVDSATLQTWHENVYALGDCAAVSIPGRWRQDVPLMLPKAGVFAHSQGKIIANNIIADITNKIEKESFCGDGYCMLEAGEGVSGFAYGNFYASPNPDVKLKKLGRIWHLGKVMFEKWWLTPPGFKKDFYGWMMRIGGKIFGIKVDL